MAQEEDDKAKKLADEQSAKAEKLAKAAEIARDEYEGYKAETTDWQNRQDEKQESDATELRAWQRAEDVKRHAKATVLKEEQASRDEQYAADKDAVSEEIAYIDNNRKRRYRSQLGAYLLIVILGAFGFWQVQLANDRTNHYSKQSAYDLCQGINENRKVLSDLIRSNQPLPVPENGDPNLQAVIKESNRRSGQFRTEALIKLAPKACPPTP